MPASPDSSQPTTQTTNGSLKPVKQLTHRGFSAWILIDDEPVWIHRPEYDTQTGELTASVDIEDKRIMTGWIASEEGKTFKIGWQNDLGEEAEYASSAHFIIDGKDVASAIFRPRRTRPSIRKGAKISPSVVKPFTFGRLQLTDDDDEADPNDPLAQHIGTIKVEIKFVKLGKPTRLKPVDADGPGVVHEKAKKAGMHTTTFNTVERIEKGRSVETEPLFPDDEWAHHVAFLFRYRSKDILMAEGIIPRPKAAPEPPAAEEPAPADGDAVMVDVENAEEATQAETQNAADVPVKRRIDDTEDEMSDQEAASKRAKSTHASSEDDGGLHDSEAQDNEEAQSP